MTENSVARSDCHEPGPETRLRPRRLIRDFGSLGVLLAAASLSLAVQAQGGAVSSQHSSTVTPITPRDPAGYELHNARANAAAIGAATKMLKLCDIGSNRYNWVSPPEVAPFQPVRAFDQLYYVGRPGIASWAVKTSKGIILIDALSTEQDVTEFILPNMRRLGLDPAQIKYLIVTHGHNDHYGGAPYIVEHFHPRVIASESDWQVMEAMAPQPNGRPAAPAPVRDMAVADGHKLTLGDTSIRIYVTPGHTPGTISLIIPVKDKGVPHVAVLWGGTAYPRGARAKDYLRYGTSVDRFAAIAARAHADVIVSNHSFADDTSVNLPAVVARRPGAPNPFVTGPRSVQSYLKVMSECSKARAAAD